MLRAVLQTARIVELQGAIPKAVLLAGHLFGVGTAGRWRRVWHRSRRAGRYALSAPGFPRFRDECAETLPVDFRIGNREITYFLQVREPLLGALKQSKAN